MKAQGIGEQKTTLNKSLNLAAEIINELGDAFSYISDQIKELDYRLGKERFHLAILGQFKRGKSMLVNALLGEEILPTGVVPLTAIPTFIKWGWDKEVFVDFKSGETQEEKFDTSEGLKNFLQKIATEEGNPKNVKGINSITVSIPSAILQNEVVIIDTPGIGSTHRHNTEATMDFLHNCDAAVFALSADPPITEGEVEFLKSIGKHAQHIVYVLNKIDYLEKHDQDKVISFIKDVLTDKLSLGYEPAVFPLSAKAGLQAKMENDQSLLAKSGFEAFEQYLAEFLVSSKTEMLCKAISSKLSNLLEKTVLQLQISIQSLKLPLESLDERIAVLEEKLKQIDSQRLKAADLLEGDKKRLVEFLEMEAKGLRDKARSFLGGIVAGEFEANPCPSEAVVKSLVAEAVPEFFDTELENFGALFRGKVTVTLEPHIKTAGQLIDDVNRVAAELYNIPYRPRGEQTLFEMKKLPYWVTEKWSTGYASLPPQVWERILPARLRISRMKTRLTEETESIVKRNVENLRWAILQNVEQAFRIFAHDLEKQMQQAVQGTKGAMVSARTKRHLSEKDVLHELEQLEMRLTALVKLHQTLNQEAHCAKVAEEVAKAETGTTSV